MSKRIFLILLSFILIFSFTGCRKTSIIGGAVNNYKEFLEEKTDIFIEETNSNSNVGTIVDEFAEGANSLANTIEEIKEDVENEQNVLYFNAYVIEVIGNTLLVEPFKHSDIYKDSDKIFVYPLESCPDCEFCDFSKFNKGDIVEIIYQDISFDTYPGQVYSNEIYLIGHGIVDGEEPEFILPDDSPIHDLIIDKDELIIKKPIIYLYPEEAMKVKVEISFDGDFIYTNPVSSNGIWDVYAYPNGDLINLQDGREHSYIFWEGVSDVDWDLSKGFVVEGKDTLAFLEEKLAILGLNEKEANEFINYWVPLMQDNTYNYITFQNEVYTDNFELNVYPKPDSTLRVFMVYKALDEPIETIEPTLTTFNRNGFCVVEWGGTEIK